MKKSVPIFALLFLQFNLFSQPKINSFSPIKDSVGSIVTINGSNFSTTPANNIVRFGAVQAVVISATQNVIKTKVPVGANYRPLSVTVNGLTASSNSPFIVIFADADTTFTANTFAPRKDFVNGAQPLNVATGDLDGDGKPDVAVTNGTSKAVSFFLNKGMPGTVSFADKIDYTTGNFGPHGISINDIDGDGKMDVIVTIENSTAVAVYKNLSTPGILSFAPRIEFTTGVTPRGLAVRDLDGDGKPDLAVANYNGNPTINSTISIFKNSSTIGTISFLPKIDFATNIAPSDLSIADLDGDEKPDIALVNYDSDSLSVYKNNSATGNISFGPKVNYKTGIHPFRIVTGDLDDDNKADIALTNDGSHTISVFKNSSVPGTISLSPKIDYPFASNGNKISLGDMNGDGRPDIVVTGNNISVLKNISTPGNIAFKNKVDYSYSTTSDSYASDLLDCDGDGKLDIVLTDFGYVTTNLSVLRFVGNPILPTTQPIGIYPNPVRSILTIHLKDMFTQIRVIDATGRLILKKDITSTTIYQLNVSNFSAGFYILEIFDVTGHSRSAKFIVN